ncbi:hypothetical protein [Oryzisolibacter sp. LB2S]|uniref:hypothetical protein n=1 Tax=Alicycliphilus soli TaxID=3228789 RepID=UPI003458318E
MSSAPRDNGEATVMQAGARAPRAESSPGAAARRPAAARAALRMPAALRWALLALVFLLLLGSTWFASRQAPHPDMFRPMGNWDVGSLDWWRYPLERNAFKRRIVRGDLNAVFLLPGTQKLWAVGSRGLVLHSEDGGATWAQQMPAPHDAGRRHAHQGVGRLVNAAAGDCGGASRTKGTAGTDAGDSTWDGLRLQATRADSARRHRHCTAVNARQDA